MEISKEQVILILSSLDELQEELSFNNHGDLWSEQIDLYNYLKSQL